MNNQNTQTNLQTSDPISLKGSNGMKVLLTGGAGFIGSHVAEEYLNAGYQVVIIDNLSSGNISNIPKGAKFYQADINNYWEMEEIFSLEKPAIVNHHAGQISVNSSVQNPIHDATVNVLGSINLLELSVAHNVKQFIFASSGGATYDDNQIPASEATLQKPKSPYGISQMTTEKYMAYYRDIRGLKTTVLRYSNVYGPRQLSKGENAVIPNFINKLRIGAQPIIFGDGNQTRDFVNARDIATANVLVTHKQYGGVLNISSGKETSVNELIDVFSKILGRYIEPEYREGKAGEQRRSAMTNHLANTTIGWCPSVSLENGLAELMGVTVKSL